MHYNTTIARVHADPWGATLKLYLAHKSGSGETIGVPSITWTEQPIGSEYPDSALSLDKDRAQELANSLWEAGVRPSQAGHTIGQAEAMQKHIDDLRETNRRLLSMLEKGTNAT